MPLPLPVGKQVEVVCLGASGHQVVLGTAGSGKTTMAILRAASLAHPKLPGHGPTLLVTFNKALVAFIKSIGSAELVNVRVENFHKFARGYLNARGKMAGDAILSRPDGVLASAIERVKLRHPGNALFTRPLGFFTSEISWLAGHGITSSADYSAVNRSGRAEARLERVLRPVMWEVREEYLAARSGLGYGYDWDDIATAVSAELDSDTTARHYRHVVIDEGQDFSPEMLRALSKAVPPDGSITFFGDVAQQIYGHRMSWRSAGLNAPHVWQFAENYRNTREIAQLGLAVAAMPYYAGATDMVVPNAPSAAGVKPTLVHASSDLIELTLIADQARRLSTTQSVVVLARTLKQVEQLRGILPPNAVPLRNDRLHWVSGPSLYYGTYHSAKGLEFDAVMLPFLSEGLFPDPAFEKDLGAPEADANDGRLLYVGITRAKRALILTFTGTASRLLPRDVSLYAVVTR